MDNQCRSGASSRSGPLSYRHLEPTARERCRGYQLHIVRTTRNSAFPLIIRA